MSFRSSVIPPHLRNMFMVMTLLVMASTPRAWSQQARPEQPLFKGALLVDAQGGGMRDAIKLRRLIEEIQRSPFDEIHIQVRSFGDAYYESSVVPLAYGVSRMISQTERFDPLAILIRELKSGRRPRKVFAWIDLLRVANKNRPVPEADNHVARVHPEWLSRNAAFANADDEGNQYLEPGLDGVQSHLEAVVAELAHRYELDGILIGQARYPGFEAGWGYIPDMIDLWRAKSGDAGKPTPDDPAWIEIRRTALSNLVDRLARAARNERPSIKIAVTGLAEGVFPTTIEEFVLTPVYQGALQDWPGWMKNKSVDCVYLENFHAEADAATVFDGWNYFAGKMAQDFGAEAVALVLGEANISIDALAQMKRTQETGLSGAGLATLSVPSQDANSKEIFFRALANSVFAEDSHRKPFEALPPGPASGRPAVAHAGSLPALPEQGGSLPEDEEEMPPPPTLEGVRDEDEPVAGPTPAVAGGRIDSALHQANVQRAEELIRPRREALEYLKRRFKNIF